MDRLHTDTELGGIGCSLDANALRPTECAKCGGMIEPGYLACGYCGTLMDGVVTRVELPDGRWVNAYPDGAVSVEFPDGREALITKSGTVAVEFPDGREAWIFRDGTANVEFPDGREAWIHEDGTARGVNETVSSPKR